MSEIRVNTIVAAEGTSAPNLPYGIQVPTGMGITGAGGVNISGVVTAANIDGTLIAGSAINSAGVSTVGILTVTKDARIGAAVTVDGAATITGAVNIDATTDSTSTTTGALIVDGGLGVAKNVYIGAGLSVAGTLTYEDVTNVDSVGLITAKSGVNISGGQLQVGVAYSVGAAGVCTAAGFVGPLTGAVTGNADTATSATNATHVYVTDNESTNENNLITFVEDATSSTGNVGLEMDGNLTYNPSTGNLTATQLTGTLQTAAQTNVTSVGTLAGLTVGSAGEFKVGTAVTISSTSGVSTFANDVVFVGSGGKNVEWDKSNGAFELNDDARIKIGDSADLSLYHDGTNSYIQHGNQGNLRYQSGNHDFYNQAGDEFQCRMTQNAGVQLYYDSGERYATTGAGSTSVGISTFQDFSAIGMLKERVEIIANKLSAATNINLDSGNIHYFTTNETTTATPNVRYSSAQSLNNKMLIGETVTVTIISKPNGAGYYTHLTVDGSSVTEYWNGGNTPSSANAGGFDVTTYQITKTANATYHVLANVQNYS